MSGVSVSTKLRPWRAPVLAGAAALALTACASYPLLQASVQTPEQRDRADDAPVVEGGRDNAEVLTLPSTPPALSAPLPSPLSDAQIEALVPEGSVQTALVPQTLPQFIDAALGDILQLPYALGPGVAARSDVISVRAPSSLSARDFLSLVQIALSDYGIRLSVDGGTLRVLDEYASTGEPPNVFRGRSALGGLPPGRSVIQFYEVATIEASALSSLLQSIARPSGVTIETAPSERAGNYLILRGSARDVAAVVNTLRSLDQPRFAGQQVLRVEPIFWQAPAFAQALASALTVEGYDVSSQAGNPRAITILAFQPTNQVFIFTAGPDLAERAAYWVDQLDRPSAIGSDETTFVYQARNMNAESLGSLLTGQGGGRGRPPAGQEPGTAGQPSEAAAQDGAQVSSGSVAGGSITIDPIGNRILFTGTPTAYARVRELLEVLDQPPPQILVEVIVAEVTLTDETRLGLEFFFEEARNNGVYSGGTSGGLGLQDGGLLINFEGVDLLASFNAFASNNQVTILSRPRLLARSGSEAFIQVGTDVPIVTSQRASDVQTGGDTDVLQSVQYRQTGVILTVRPIAYGDRVDIEVTQEVSSQQVNPNAAIASPLILNRSIVTQLSVADGATAVLGGLIDDNFTHGNVGVPILKDIPILGSIFRTDTVTGGQTELVVLLTPYIIRDDAAMAAAAAGEVERLNAAFRVGRGWSYTLTPLPFGGRGLGLSLPARGVERGAAGEIQTDEDSSEEGREP